VAVAAVKPLLAIPMKQKASARNRFKKGRPLRILTSYGAHNIGKERLI